MSTREPFGDTSHTISDDDFRDALLSCCSKELDQLLLETKEEKTFQLHLSFISLCSTSLSIAYALYHHARPTLQSLNNAAIDAQRCMLEEAVDRTQRSVKDPVRVLLHDLFYAIDLQCSADLVCEHIGRLLSFNCTVIRTGERKVIAAEKMLDCPNCQVKMDDRQDEVVCPSCRHTLGEASDQEASNSSLHTDYQEIKVQQRTDLPRPIAVILEDDLVDSCQDGEVTGVVVIRGAPTRSNAKTTADFIILANNVQKQKTGRLEDSNAAEDFSVFWEKHRQQPLFIRNLLVSHVCPQLHGQLKVKLALLLMLVGGCSVDSSFLNNCSTRSNIHFLLIGDPGTGKSQFMKFASLISPRCVLTNGKGSTSAGLTASAIKHDGIWSLEAGALVQADGGICCIDEFNGIQEQDHSVVHEVMEQQTLSIAKGGMVTTLNARASVFGCMNPSGMCWKPKKSLSDNSRLSLPLISRFDIILSVLDGRDASSDRQLADHILQLHQQDTIPDVEWSVKRLRQYIDWIRKQFHPRMTPEANKILKTYYQYLRQRKSRNSTKITVRSLEALIRLSQAHARLLARHEALLQDAISSILLYESSVFSSGDFETNLESFLESTQPDEDYKLIEFNFLNELRMQK